jgi:signal transduction histidine kinase
LPLFAVLLVRRIVRERDARAEELAARAELLEREQEIRIREAAELERATIARELHDVVAHRVSVMVVQAGAERSVLDPGETSTVETLRTIEATGREALVELRRLLGVLRSGEPQSLAPQPTLGDVDALVAQIRDAGVEVDLTLDGEPRALAPGVELSAFRIVQEGLTNILKHAAGAHAYVTLRFGAEELEIEVRDDGGPATASGPGTGHGLLGITERVALHGGRLIAGPSADGFSVRAWLPASA